MLSSLTAPYKRYQYQQLDSNQMNAKKYTDNIQTTSRLAIVPNQPIRSVASNSRLQSLVVVAQFNTNQQNRMRFQLQQFIRLCLDPTSPSTDITVKEARKMVLDRHTDTVPLYLPTIDGAENYYNQKGINYESHLIHSAYTKSGTENSNEYSDILKDKLEKSLNIVDACDFSSISSIKESCIELARLYLLHPTSQSEIFTRNRGVTSCNSHSKSYIFDDHAQQLKALLAKSIEICHQSVALLTSMKSDTCDETLQFDIDEAIAEILMQEAQGCYAHQPIDRNYDRFSLTGGCHDVSSVRLKEAGQIYSNLIQKSKNSCSRIKLQEKLADISVLMGCISYERESYVIPLKNLPWAKNENTKGICGSRHVYKKPSFVEHCFQQAQVQLRHIIKTENLEPKDWIRIHCKYASALTKQGLTLPFFNDRNDALKPLIHSELRAIKKYLFKNKNCLVAQDQVRAFIKLSDLVCSNAVQQLDRDSYHCVPTRQMTQVMKKQQAKFIANYAYHIMAKNGGAKAMPFEARFLKRRSSYSAEFMKKYYDKPYAATAAALYEHDSQWFPKINIVMIGWMERKGTMHS